MSNDYFKGFQEKVQEHYIPPKKRNEKFQNDWEDALKNEKRLFLGIDNCGVVVEFFDKAKLKWSDLLEEEPPSKSTDEPPFSKAEDGWEVAVSHRARKQQDPKTAYRSVESSDQAWKPRNQWSSAGDRSDRKSPGPTLRSGNFR